MVLAGVVADTVELAASRPGEKPWEGPRAGSALGNLAFAASPGAGEEWRQGNHTPSAEPPVELLAAARGTCAEPQKYGCTRRVPEPGAEPALPGGQVAGGLPAIQMPSAGAVAGRAS